MPSSSRSLFRRLASLRESLDKESGPEKRDFSRDLDFRRLALDLMEGCLDPSVMKETIDLWRVLRDRRGPGSRIAREKIVSTLKFASINLEMEGPRLRPGRETAGLLALDFGPEDRPGSAARDDTPDPKRGLSEAAETLAEEALRVATDSAKARSLRVVNLRLDFWEMLAGLVETLDSATVEAIREAALTRIDDDRVDDREKTGAVSALSSTFFEEDPDATTEECLSSLATEAVSEDLFSAAVHARVELGLLDELSALVMLEDFRDEKDEGEPR